MASAAYEEKKSLSIKRKEEIMNVLQYEFVFPKVIIDRWLHWILMDPKFEWNIQRICGVNEWTYFHDFISFFKFLIDYRWVIDFHFNVSVTITHVNWFSYNGISKIKIIHNDRTIREIISSNLLLSQSLCNSMTMTRCVFFRVMDDRFDWKINLPMISRGKFIQSHLSSDTNSFSKTWRRAVQSHEVNCHATNHCVQYRLTKDNTI